MVGPKITAAKTEPKLRVQKVRQARSIRQKLNVRSLRLDIQDESRPAPPPK